jgi:hypothetical protein
MNGLATEGLVWAQGIWYAQLATPMDGPNSRNGL